MLKRNILVLAILVIVLSFFHQAMAEEQMWGTDVLVHQANRIYGFGMDQGDKDTLLLVVSDSSTTNSQDTLHVYRSTDNGQNWNHVKHMVGDPDVRFGKADIITAKGDSNFTFLFYVYATALWCDRFPYNLSGGRIAMGISAGYENVRDFSVCQDLYSDYSLYVVYQTDQDSVIFKTSGDYGKTWTQRENLTETTPIVSKPSIAWSQGAYLVVAGKTSDGKIYVIRNDDYGSSADWKDGQYPYPGGLVDCDNPVVAGSHTSPADSAIFWLFYQRYVALLVPARWVLQFHYSTDACSTWSSLWSPNDTSTGNRVLPSLHVLKENDVSDITLAYFYEGTSPHQIRYIYLENAQSSPHNFWASYSGVNDYDPVALPHQKAYTIRTTGNSIVSAILYVDSSGGLYFDASSFTAVEDEVEDKPIRRFSLDQNYPNPFNPTTKIEFVLSKSGQVRIDIFNILGEKVKTLMDQHLKAGRQLVEWDGKDESGEEVASGVYFYRLQTKDFTQTKKMVLMR